MKKFVLRILIYCSVIFGCTALLWRILISVKNDYSIHSHETNVHKQIERLDTMSSPKIIIIGGSGCGFGICSPLLQEHYNLNVCNTGTHAGLGLNLQINLFRKYITTNDIVIVIPEYEQYTKMFYGDETALRILTSIYPEGYKQVSFLQQMHLYRYVPMAFTDAQKSKGMGIFGDTIPYAKEAVNEFGDVERYANRNHENKEWKPNILKGCISVIPFLILKDFNEECKEKRVHLFIFPPAFRQEAFECNKSKINEIWSRLEKNNLPVVSYPEAYMLPDSLFYDTDYHLTYEGVIIRTNKLIADIDSLGIIK